MSTDAQTILNSARALPLNEQLEVLQGLAQSLAQALSPLTDASATFWSQRPLDELASERQAPIIRDLESLALFDTSPESGAGESADDMIAYLYAQRRADRTA